jgi:hypothetical protein
MSDLEPGVVLSPSTLAAMERLSTPTSKPSVTEHTHTLIWPKVEDLGAAVTELRDRIEALEAAQQPPQDKLDRLIALDRDDPANTTNQED